MVRLSLLLVGGAAAANLLRGTARRTGDDTDETLDPTIEEIDTDKMAKYVEPIDSLKDMKQIQESFLSQLGVPNEEFEQVEKQMKEMMKKLPEVIDKAQKMVAKCPIECTKDDKECPHKALKCVLENLQNEIPQDGKQDVKEAFQVMQKELPQAFERVQEAMKHLEQHEEECSKKSKIVCSEDTAQCSRNQQMAKFQCMVKNAPVLDQLVSMKPLQENEDTEKQAE